MHDPRCCKQLYSCPLARGGVLPTQTPLHNSRCCKRLLSCPSARGGVLPTQTLMQDCRCCKQLFTCPIPKGESYPPKLRWMTPDVSDNYSLAISKGGVLPTQIPVHYARCCNRHFCCPLAREKSYPPKL